MPDQRDMEVHRTEGATVRSAEVQALARVLYPTVHALPFSTLPRGARLEAMGSDGETGLPARVEVWIPHVEHFFVGDNKVPSVIECGERWIELLTRYLGWVEAQPPI